MVTDRLAEIAGLSVLAVDDHSINREFLRSALGPRVARLELASSGHDAIAACRTATFDLVLMDLHMPDLDGLTTWQRIVEEAGGEPLPKVIALTADCREEERKRLRAAGFDGFLNKPVSLEVLSRTVAAVMAGRSGFEQPEAGDRRRRGLLDDERALAASNRKPELVARFRSMLLEELDGHHDELDHLLAAGQFAGAGEILHRWAGACGYAGANQLEQGCRALLQSLNRDLDSSPGTLYVQLINQLTATCQAIRAGSAGPARA